MKIKRNKILIYRDYGCANVYPLYRSLNDYFSPFGYKLEFTDAQSIINESVLDSSVFAFFMPGGAGIPYEMKLKGKGNDKIRSYVTKGGFYFGICAGAYYACKHTIFEHDIPELCILSDSGLDLINGSAIGTLHSELNIKPYSASIESSTIAKVCYNDSKIHYAYYSGGPYFDISQDSAANILAEYDFETKKLPAILHKNYGTGSVIISGIHYEYKASDLMQSIFKSHPEFDSYKKLAKNLSDVECYRQSLFNKIMSNLKQKDR